MRQLITFFAASIIALAPASAQDAPKPEKEDIEPVSKADFLSERRAQFNKADANFDGRLTPHEMNLARFETRKKDFEKRFKELDADFSGYLSMREIRDWHEQNTEKRIAGIDRQRDNFLKKYDLDGNGTISAYEIETVFDEMKESQRERIETSAKSDMKRKDKDESGSVSLEEYIESKMPKPRNQPFREDQKTTIQDGNGDGIITRAENEKFINDIFEHLDKNGDDELSEREQGHNAFRTFKNFQPNAVYLFSDEFPGTGIELRDRNR